MRLGKKIMVLWVLSLLILLALGLLGPLTSAISERVWWILLVLIGLALTWPRGIWEEKLLEVTKPKKTFPKRARLVAYLRAAEKSRSAKERLAEMVLELAVGILALKRGVEEKEAWQKIRSREWPKEENFWRVMRTEGRGKSFLSGFSSALDALERELG